MTRQQLVQQIKNKQSFLCVGLDSDIHKIPPHLLTYSNPIQVFNEEIIRATQDYCVAYKPNFAFYEALGAQGWQTLAQTTANIPQTHLSIADAKRGDIGNTAKQYAVSVFEQLQFDAVTLAPYMGADSILPFLQYSDKWAIILALTSNASAGEIQHFFNGNEKLYAHVLHLAKSWGTDEQLMFVVGATKAEALQEIRCIVPQHFLLVPGVGTQGGNLEDVVKYGINKEVGLLVNVSRDIIYASSGKDFAAKAAEKAAFYQSEMQRLLTKYLP
ncbi:MAG: orotidine-5'-phosphate decarboxylase [Chitinophagales bacterium]|nr:orotidine-5'-phosphate decarboxylase [Bacteroidota bacterium]MCB9043169.1 orotidine-5'-phosphate decarboxylase [Chitinophagales bacterium]